MARLSENFHIESSVNARPGAKINPMSMRLNRLWGSVQNLKNKDGKKTENKKEGAAHLSSNKFSSVSLILYTRNIRAHQNQRQTAALLCVCVVNLWLWMQELTGWKAAMHLLLPRRGNVHFGKLLANQIINPTLNKGSLGGAFKKFKLKCCLMSSIQGLRKSGWTNLHALKFVQKFKLKPA